MTLPIGKYFAVAIPEESSFGVLDNDKQTPFVEVAFRVIEGEHKDETMSQKFFLSENAAKYTIPSLKTCGCVFPGGDVMDLTGLGSRRVELVIQKQKPKPGEDESKFVEIRFINDPDAPRGAGGGKPIDDSRKADLRVRLRGLALEATAGMAPAPGAKGTIPF